MAGCPGLGGRITPEYAHGSLNCGVLRIVQYYTTFNTLFPDRIDIDHTRYYLRSIAALSIQQTATAPKGKFATQANGSPSIVVARLELFEDNQEAEFLDFVIVNGEFVRTCGNPTLQDYYMLAKLKSDNQADKNDIYWFIQRVIFYATTRLESFLKE